MYTQNGRGGCAKPLLEAALLRVRKHRWLRLKPVRNNLRSRGMTGAQRAYSGSFADRNRDEHFDFLGNPLGLKIPRGQPRAGSTPAPGTSIQACCRVAGHKSRGPQFWQRSAILISSASLWRPSCCARSVPSLPPMCGRAASVPA